MVNIEISLTQRFYQTLASSQNRPRGQVAAYQAKLLEKLARHAATTVPFYTDGKRLAPLFRADGSYDPQGWPMVEPLTRREAHENEDRLLARSVPPEMLPTHVDVTSGSTGTPLHVTHTLLARVSGRAMLGRLVTWHDGGTAAQRVATIKSIAKAQAELVAPGNLIVPTGLALNAQIAALKDFRPTLVVTYPNALINLIEQDGEALASVKLAVVTGELFSQAMRGRLAELTRMRVANLYSSTETGPIAMDDPQGLMRVCEENAFVEHGPLVVKNASQALVTPFYSFAMPLIRYAPGDLIGTLRETEGEFSGLRVLDAVHGRQRTLLRSPPGEMFFFGLRASDLTRILDYRDWQLIQHDRSRATFRIAVPEMPSDEAKAKLHALVSGMLRGLSVTIDCVAELPLSASGKLESTIREPAADLPQAAT